MNFKTLSPLNLPTVILFRAFTKKGKVTVTILTYGRCEQIEEEDAEASERIEFDSVASAKNYIEDFTEKRAAQWCAVQGISLNT